MTRHLLYRLTVVVLLLAAVPLLGQVPYQVKVINPNYSATIRDAVGMNGIGYFVASSYLNFSNGQYDEELWRTDGTEAGTFRVRDIRPGDLGSNIKWMTVIGSTLYFSANDGTTGDELWKSDGTSAGTVRVVELNVGSGGGGIGSAVEYNGALYFIGAYPSGTPYLFRSDGTAAGTVPVSTAVSPYAPTSVFPDRRLTVWNGYLWFVGGNIPFTSSGLYRSDGTSAGTTLIKALNTPGSDMVAASNQLFFTANDPTYRREVWRSDGTAAGTYMTKDLNPINSGFNGDSSAWIYWTVGDICIFSAVDGNAGFNRKLYRSDGTAGGTYLLADIYPGASDVTNASRTNADRTYMVWESSQQGASGPRHLYVTDGTTAGTVRLKTFLSFCQNFMAMDGVMYFRANDGSAAGGTELWRTNGTVAGTYRYADINPGPNGSDPYPVGFFSNIGLLLAGPSYPQLWAFRLCNSAPQPVINFSPTAVCAGNGAGTATVTNAASFTSFNWTILNGAFDSAVNGSSVSFHATSSSAVQLTVTATAAGCQQQATVSIPTAAPATPAITASGPTTFCEGGAVTLTASAGSSYAWSNGATTQSITVIASGSYSVTVTNANGCSATSAASTVTVNPLPAGMISAGGPTTFCEGGSVTLTAPAGMASYAWSNGATTQSITATTTGHYDVTFTNANGCSSTVGVPVTVHPAPAATIAASGPTTFCEGGSVTLTAGTADSYAWSNGATTQSITVNASGSYSVTVTNANGCSATSTPAVVTVNAAPSATITPTGPTTFCEGGYVGLIAPAGMASYSWSNGATGQSITATTSGTYTVTVTGANGCSATSEPVTVTRNPLPDATVSASGPTTFCEGGSVTLTAAAGMASYAWTNGSTTRSITVNASGNYAVTVTTAEGCSASSSGTPVTVNPLPSPVITVANQYTLHGPVANSAVVAESVFNYCGSVDINLIVSQPQNYTSFLWSTGATTPSIHVTGAGTYTVTVTNANGCSASDSATITVTPTPPAPQITASSPAFCPNGSVTLTASAADSYLWSTGATTQSITVTEPGSYSVSVKVNGCLSPSSSFNVAARSVAVTASGPTTFCNGGSVTLTASAADSYLWSTGATTQSISVTSSGNYAVTAGFTDGCSITSAPVPVTVGNISTSISADRTTVCPGGSIHLTSSVSGGPAASYQWYSSGGAPIPGATSATLTWTPSNGGYFYLVVTDANGCSATSNAIVYSVSEPSASITALGPTTFCEGGSTTLMANAGASYLWSTGATSPSINVTQSGSYSVTVTNADGCSATSAATVVTVNAKPATPAITAGGPTTFCEGGSVTLSAPAGYTYVWNNGATTQSITVNASGSYGVTVSNGNCTATSAPATVTVNAKPATPAITASGPTTFCQGGSVTLTAPAGFTYLWSNGATTQSINVAASGSYGVTVTNASSCSAASAATVVTVNPKPATPTISASGPTTFCEGGSVTLTAPAGYTYLWSTGAITQSIVASTSGNYTVTVTANSCSRTSAATTVVVNPPTVITAQPQNVTMRRTETRTLSVTATGTATLQYQWYEGLTGDTSKPVGTGSQLTIGPYPKKGTYRYWVRVTSTTCSGSVANSTAATVTVNN